MEMFGSLRELYNGMKTRPIPTIGKIIVAVLLVTGVAFIYGLVSNIFWPQKATTNYASQTQTNSPGGIQVQGNDNSIVAPTSTPPTLSSIAIVSPSELQADGLYQTVFDVHYTGDWGTRFTNLGLHWSNVFFKSCVSEGSKTEMFINQEGQYPALDEFVECSSANTINKVPAGAFD